MSKLRERLAMNRVAEYDFSGFEKSVKNFSDALSELKQQYELLKKYAIQNGSDEFYDEVMDMQDQYTKLLKIDEVAWEMFAKEIKTLDK